MNSTTESVEGKQEVPDNQAQLRLLDALAAEPETTQSDLAARLGVAVGTVNWYLKRYAADGYVHITRIGRWRWRYILTPRGMAEKARLATSFVDRSMRLYRETRDLARARLTEVRNSGYDRIRIEGEGDLADVCRLTCLERGIGMTQEDAAPVLRIESMTIRLIWPQTERDTGRAPRDDEDEQPS